jgi:hypothetical protein
MVSGEGLWFPRSQNRDLHPTDEDLPAGTPDLGHPAVGRGELFFEPGHLRYVVSHPGDNNKNVARVGHPASVERGPSRKKSRVRP